MSPLDEEAGNDGCEEYVTSNCSKNYSKSDRDGWDKPLYVWGDIYDVMDSKDLTLKQKEKEIPKLFFIMVKFCRQWEKDQT